MTTKDEELRKADTSVFKKTLGQSSTVRCLSFDHFSNLSNTLVSLNPVPLLSIFCHVFYFFQYGSLDYLEQTVSVALQTEGVG